MGIILNLNRLPSLREVGIQEGKSPIRVSRLSSAHEQQAASLTHQEQVELCVIVFARVVDWNGFRPLILEKLTSIEQRKVLLYSRSLRSSTCCKQGAGEQDRGLQLVQRERGCRYCTICPHRCNVNVFVAGKYELDLEDVE